MGTVGQLASHRVAMQRQHLGQITGRLGLLLVGLLLLVAERGRASEEESNEELRALQRAALRHAHLDEHSRHSLEARLRLAGFLPHLRVTVGRGLQWGYPSQADVTTPLMLAGDKMNYSLSAEWDLSRLIFAREDLALHRDAQRMAQWRTQLLLRVARLYARRCRVEQDRQLGRAPRAGDEERLSARALAFDIALVALTGDEHASRKHQHCPRTGSGSLADELESLSPAPSAPTPSAVPSDDLDSPEP